MDLSVVVTITVTHNPELGPLRAQLAALPVESLKLVIDNASEPETLEQVETLARHTPRVRVLRNTSNLGLAAAINIGVQAARQQAPRARWVLLLDQDSKPHPGSIATLVDGFCALERQGKRVGCVGPLLLDIATGLSHGFHQATRWHWTRIYPSAGSTAAVPCTNLNGSGTLVPFDIFRRFGGLDEALFIDHVDTDWSFRILAGGYGLWGIPAAVFSHQMGRSSVRFWLFGWRVWPSRSPRRHYFLFRNAVALMRRPYVPRVWKFWALVKLALTAMVQGLIDPERRAQWRQMRLGVRDGLHMSSRPAAARPP